MKQIQKAGGACVFACMALTADITHAQTTQTADGAQTFLAQMIERATVTADFTDTLDPTKGLNYITGTETIRHNGKVHQVNQTVTFGEHLWLYVKAMDAVDLHGAPDACTTRVTRLQPWAEVNRVAHGTEAGIFRMIDVTHTYEYEDRVTKFAGPHYIDWRKAGVSREGNTLITRGQGPKYGIILRFRTTDTATADRIEYAMKFLKASCDETVNTGF